MDVTSLDANSSCILYQVINDEFCSDTNSIRIQKSKSQLPDDLSPE